MKKLTLIALISFITTIGFSQWNYYYQYGLIPESQLDEIAGEASGEQAFQHIIEMAAYNRPRPLEEYATTLMESVYVMDKLKEYGIKNGQVERFGKTSTWKGLKGRLWEVSPNRTKILDYDDSPLFLASGSNNAKVKAEMIWVGRGTATEIANLDLTDKLVVTEGSLRNMGLWISNGAVGALTFESSRPLIDPMQIPTAGIRGAGDKGFAFRIPPRDGHKIRNRLLKGEKIVVEAEVETTRVELDIQVPSCVIEGTEPNGEEVILCAHIYEGYVKQGANDNISGSAAILDIVRVLNKLYEEGRLERPKRNIRFIWVPEFSGTIPWVKAHQDIMDRTLCNINMDMVGIKMAENQSFLNMHRTTMGNPHYINDVMECYMRYISETNKIRCTPVGRFNFLKPMIAPTGTDDPFYYNTEAYLGASDHAVFNDWAVGVPGILLNNWPDHYYQTSNDRANVCDPTQMKRVVFLGAAAAHSIASAGDEGAMNIAAEVMGNAGHRMGHQLTICSHSIANADSDQLGGIYKKAVSDLWAVYTNEKETLESVFELMVTPDVKNAMKSQIENLMHIWDNQTESLKHLMIAKASVLGIDPVDLSKTREEKMAARMVPVPTEKVEENGYGGYRDIINSVPDATKKKYPYPSLARNSREANLLCNGKHNALEIKKMLDVQYPTDVDLQDLVNYIKILEKAGLVEVVTKMD